MKILLIVSCFVGFQLQRKFHILFFFKFSVVNFITFILWPKHLIKLRLAHRGNNNELMIVNGCDVILYCFNNLKKIITIFYNRMN